MLKDIFNTEDHAEIVQKSKKLLFKSDVNLILKLLSFLSEKNVRDMVFLEEISNFLVR